MRHLLFSVIIFLFFPFSIFSQQSLSKDIVSIIEREALENSQIEALSFYFTDYAGPRLAASKLGERAELLAKEKLAELGFSNPRIEKATDFPRGGWDNLKTYAAMTAPYYCNFMATPKAWSGSTDGVVQGEVVLLQINTMEDLDKYRGTLTNKIVLMPPQPWLRTYTMSFSPLATRLNDSILSEMSVARSPRPALPRPPAGTPDTTPKPQERDIIKLLAAERPAVIIHTGGKFNVSRSSDSYHSHWIQPPVADLALPIEAHGRMVRLISQNIPVSMEVEITNEFYDHAVINNVFAEIPGTDPELKDQIVLIGAHLDSWHGGTGATDNAAGCMVMIEALRLIKETGVQPRRTIRIALWGGEELGKIGSMAYVNTHLYDSKLKSAREGYDHFALYLNMDHGSGKIRGICLNQNETATPFFQEWFTPLACKDSFVLSPRSSEGGSDHKSFDQIGLPAFYFIQDPLEYDRAYHTIMDTYERLILTDLQYNAIVVAVLALSAAIDDGKIPPKPLPAN